MPLTTISSHTLFATNTVSPGSHQLGPLDSLVTPYIPVAVVFVYPSLDLHRLQTALSVLLNYYPLLTGRLKLSDGSRSLHRLGAGAELIVAESSEQLQHSVALLDLPERGNALLPPFDVNAIYTAPVFAVQYTRFPSGHTSLGIRVLHTICDADGFYQLARDLAELYRGAADGTTPSLKHEPYTQSYLPRPMTAEERTSARKFKPEEYLIQPDIAPPSSSVIPTPVDNPPPPATGRFIHFGRRELLALKSLATRADSSSWVSTFSALAAHLYRKIHLARLRLRIQNPLIGPLSRTDFLMPINIRIGLGLPSRYFGNAILTRSTTIDAEALASGPLWDIANVIQATSRAGTSAAELAGTVSWMSAQEDMSKITTRFQYGSGSFMLSQWSKFDQYTGMSLDAPPLLVAPPFTSISLMDGLGYTLPAPDGGLIVALALSEPLWEVVERHGGWQS